MKLVIARVAGVASMLALGVGEAFAGNRGRYDAPPSTHAPEIDPVQGLAAFAILICVGLVVRERFLREKPASN